MKTNIKLLSKRLSSLIMPLLFIILSFNVSLFAQTKVVGYFTHYRRNIYPADSLQINNLTHVIHDCAWANADGTIYTPNGFLYPALNTKVHNAGKKILLCFGSDGISTFANFGTVISNSSLRATFVNNITNYLIANNYDGADFDWESPTCGADEANFLAFITALRASFNAKSPQLLITLAITVNSYYGQWFNYESLTPIVDWYNMMGYDIHGSWISHTGHNAPLYDGSDTHGCGSDDDGIAYLNGSRGIPKSKIVLGVPFYGYEYTGATGFLSSYSTVSQLSYSDILTAAKTGGFVYHWDSASQVPYYMNTSSGTFISFDDTTSIKAKANYSAAQGLGGVMIWELDNDLVSGHQPLLETLGKTLLGNNTAPVVNLPAQVILLSPVNSALNQPVQLNLTWHKAAYASNYTLQVATDVNFTNIIVNSSSITDTTKSVTSLANNTKYYWRVQGVNQNGAGSQSSTNSFTTIAAILIPGKPTPLAPLNGAVNQANSLQLKWTKVSGATSYLVQLSRSSTFSSLDLADSSLTDSVRQISSLLNNTIYYWRVRTKNTAGIGSWSNSFSFTTIAVVTIPGKPTLVAPLNSALNQAISLQLKWTKVSGATSYLVQLSRSSNFSSLDLADSSLTDTVRQISSLLSNTIYYWRVRAKNTAGIGAWSSSFSFTTITVISIPGNPTLVAPLNSALNQAISLQLKWTKVSGATTYLVQLSRSSSFNSLDIADSSLIDTVKQLSILLNNTFYYWRVRAKNVAGIGTWSATYTFTTVALVTIPGQPTPLSPLNNAINQAISLQLKWTKVPGATSYIVQLSRSSTFSSLDLADSSVTDTVRQISSLLNNTIYYWRVKAKNTAGMGVGSNSFSFTTVSLITNNPPVLVYPSNGQRNLSTQITFRWGKANNTVNYTLQVAKDNLFSQLVINDTQITDTTRSETIKYRNTKLYWRVASINSAGVSTWSNIWSFTTSLSAPYRLTAALDQPSEIILTWQDSSVTTLTQYKIERNTSLDTNFVVIDSVSADQTSYIDKSITAGITYDYRIKGVSNLIESDYSNEVCIGTTITAVKSSSLSNTYELMQNYPNPFNPSTAITYQLAALSKVQIKIFDIMGREVKTLVNDERPAGKYQIVWNATDNSGNKVTSGIYICSLRTNSYAQSRKMILMK